MQAGCLRFHRACSIVMFLVSSGSPESRTQRHPVISRVWATGPRLPMRAHFSVHIFHAVDVCSFAHLSRSGSGGARIRVSWSSARRYTISATDPTKQPDVLMTPGFRYSLQNVGPGITCAMDNRRAYSPYDRRTVLSLSIVVWYLAVTLNCLFLLTAAYLSNTLDAARYRKIPKNSRQFDDQELIFFCPQFQGCSDSTFFF